MDQSEDDMVNIIASSHHILYYGNNLTQHSQKIARAVLKAKYLCDTDNIGLPLFEFIDWSNPDPAVDENDDLKGALALDHLLKAGNDCDSNLSFATVWKATGVSYLDVAGHIVSIVLDEFSIVL